MTSAFDTVDHSILLNRIRDLGIVDGAYTWIANYLTNRSQIIRITNTTDSPAQLLSCGVPQGSVLGPILFSFYIRPLGALIQRHDVPYKFYADDLQLFYSFNPTSADTAISKLELCAREIRLWLLHNMLSLNTEKSELLLLGTTQQLRKFPDFSLTVGESILTRKSNVRDLGVILDENMRFDNHVKTVCRNAFFYLKSISRMRRSLSQRHATILIHALVLSRIDFCSALLIGIKKNLLHKLQRLIIASQRFISACPNYTKKSASISTPSTVYHSSAINRLHLRALTIVWRALHSRTPSFVSDFFQSDLSQRYLRSSTAQNLKVPFMRTELGKRAFSVYSSRLWNDLPANIRTTHKEQEFIKLCKEHFESNMI
jgi:hypothetical protein